MPSTSDTKFGGIQFFITIIRLTIVNEIFVLFTGGPKHPRRRDPKRPGANPLEQVQRPDHHL